MSRKGIIYIGLLLLQYLFFSVLISLNGEFSIWVGLCDSFHFYLLTLLYWWFPFILINNYE